MVLVLRAPLLGLLLAAGCAAAPPASAPCGGSLGPGAPWCTAREFPGPNPPPPLDDGQVAAALLASCPPATADDPTPGLSPGGRWAKAHIPTRNVVPSMIPIEIEALERLLPGAPAGSTDRRNILDRLAMGRLQQEVYAYEDCRNQAVRRDPQRVFDLTRSLRESREGAQRACALLRWDYPEHTPSVPCPP